MKENGEDWMTIMIKHRLASRKKNRQTKILILQYVSFDHLNTRAMVVSSRFNKNINYLYLSFY